MCGRLDTTKIILLKEVIIIGASGHGRVIADILEETPEYRILGFIDSYKAKGTQVLGYQVLGDLGDMEKEFKDRAVHAIVGIGDNWTRKTIALEAKQLCPRMHYINAVHPSAVISKYSKMGQGVVVVAGSVINAGAQIGNHTIINTKSSVGHDTVLRDYSSLASGVTIGGNVQIGELSAISLGAVVRNNIRIGDNTVIGSCSYVNQAIGDNVLAIGSPAVVINTREPGEKYL